MIKEAQLPTDLPPQFVEYLGTFLKTLQLTPVHRIANLPRLLEQAQLDLHNLRMGAIKILNYRDITANQLRTNNRFLGDCIECSMQQFVAFIEKRPILDGNIKPAIVLVKNSRSWNHFMFAVLEDSSGSLVLFDNGQDNKPILIEKKSAVIELGNFGTCRIVTVFDEPSKSWMLGSTDTYSLERGVDGWDISEMPFTSTIGEAKDLGLPEELGQLALKVQKVEPYVDIIALTTEVSVLELAPEGDLARLIFKLRPK